MDSKIRVLIGILATGTILLGGGYIWKVRVKRLDCSKISSMSNSEKCIEERIEATGLLECARPGVSPKAGVHYLKFEDGTELRFLEEYPNCKSYDGKNIRAVGKLYQCGELDQCSGVGLVNIDSVDLVEDEEVIKKLISEDLSKFENIENARISFDQIEIKGNQASVEIFIRWGKGLGVGYTCSLTKEGGKWVIISRERTIVE